jgi:succinate dehydrogenase / fumarate reductase, cytochrome b subunit
MMALTGQVLVIFILFHILGNSTIFFHELNGYASALHALPVVVWGGRLVIVLAFMLHLGYGALLTLENRASKPKHYAKTSFRNATFAGRYQIWTGVVIAAFLIYHLLQFTFRVTNADVSADLHQDFLGRPDVFRMVVLSFQQIGIAGIYIVSLAALGLHLIHGIQSSLQTWGMANESSLPIIEKSGATASVILFLWYAAIPIAIVCGIL